MIITNNAKGLRGVQTVAGPVYLEPGQAADLDVSDADLSGIQGNPDFAVETPAAKRKVKVEG